LHVSRLVTVSQQKKHRRCFWSDVEHESLGAFFSHFFLQKYRISTFEDDYVIIWMENVFGFITFVLCAVCGF
jgi:hypothetical protein